jgi:hypothetical protein
MQAPREPASHESKADESDLDAEFAEFCYWHVIDISSSTGGRFASVSDRYQAMRCTYLAIQVEFGSIQNQPDKVRRPVDDPATVKPSTFDDEQPSQQIINWPKLP